VNAEIITIGEEIISGHTLDTNSAFIAGKLSEIGIAVRYRVSVGDRADDIKEAILAAWKRSAVTIATGGLGPTTDDITKKAICSAFERKLVFHDDLLKLLENRFRNLHRKLPAVAQNQALQPQGADLLDNPIGSAPGILFQEADRCFIALPGVPSEMEAIVSQSVLPYLRKRQGRGHIEIRRLRTTGITESELSEAVADLEPTQDHFRLAYLPGYQGVDLRLVCHASNEAEGKAEVDKLAEAIVGRVGGFIYTIGDQTISEVVGSLLTSAGKTVATAESCTGGLVAKMLTDISGSSSYFLGSIVAYSNDVKHDLLKVPTELLQEYGAVSAQVAEAMAAGIRNVIGADYGLSLTGIAGPDGGTPEKPVGLVYIGCAQASGVVSKKINLFGTRQRVRERSATMALNILRKTIIGR
jgi:nicotinamide-nucleotide amidase